MPDDLPISVVRARADEMKYLPEHERRAAIEASPNVVGFGRVGDRARQQQLETSYRRPTGGGVA